MSQNIYSIVMMVKVHLEWSSLYIIVIVFVVEGCERDDTNIIATNYLFPVNEADGNLVMYSLTCAANSCACEAVKHHKTYRRMLISPQIMTWDKCTSQ